MIIHQSWKTDQIPIQFETWQATWTEKHPDWDYHFWTDGDNLELVKSKFSWFLSTYQSLRNNVMRADSARYMYMYEYGGFYVDLDGECLESHHPLSLCGGVLLPLLSDEYNLLENIPNAWLASIPKHPFWIHMLNRIMEKNGGLNEDVVGITGPIALYHAVGEFYAKHLSELHENPVRFVQEGLIFPFNWYQPPHEINSVCSGSKRQIKTFDTDKCKEVLGVFPRKAYAITYWSHTWSEPRGLYRLLDDSIYWMKTNMLTSICLVLLVLVSIWYRYGHSSQKLKTDQIIPK